MARMPTKPVPSDSLSHQSIADDIAAFRKRGGRIEVLGTTPLRTAAPTAFRSSTSQRKPSAGTQRKTAG
jgi:S-adenosylmethionine:tRNA-ribosyltransferase-isomerase (queuine synthetase)